MDGSCRRIGRNLGDRVLRPAELARSPAKVTREMPAPRRNREAYGAVALGRAFGRRLARRPCGHEMITRLEYIGDPWQRKPRLCIPSRLTGRIIMAGEGSRLASIAPICSNPARPIGVRKPVLRGSLSYPALGHHVRDAWPAQRPRESRSNAELGGVNRCDSMEPTTPRAIRDNTRESGPAA